MPIPRSYVNQIISTISRICTKYEERVKYTLPSPFIQFWVVPEDPYTNIYAAATDGSVVGVFKAPIAPNTGQVLDISEVAHYTVLPASLKAGIEAGDIFDMDWFKKSDHKYQAVQFWGMYPYVASTAPWKNRAINPKVFNKEIKSNGTKTISGNYTESGIAKIAYIRPDYLSAINKGYKSIGMEYQVTGFPMDGKYTQFHGKSGDVELDYLIGSSRYDAPLLENRIIMDVKKADLENALGRFNGIKHGNHSALLEVRDGKFTITAYANEYLDSVTVEIPCTTEPGNTEPGKKPCSFWVSSVDWIKREMKNLPASFPVYKPSHEGREGNYCYFGDTIVLCAVVAPTLPKPTERELLDVLELSPDEYKRIMAAVQDYCPTALKSPDGTFTRPPKLYLSGNSYLFLTAHNNQLAILGNLDDFNDDDKFYLFPNREMSKLKLEQDNCHIKISFYHESIKPDKHSDALSYCFLEIEGNGTKAKIASLGKNDWTLEKIKGVDCSLKSHQLNAQTTVHQVKVSNLLTTIDWDNERVWLTFYEPVEFNVERFLKVLTTLKNLGKEDITLNLSPVNYSVQCGGFKVISPY